MLPAENGIALEGPTFRSMPEEELLPLLPRLQVGRTTFNVWGLGCLGI